jgi:hypothetical protein
MPKESLEIVKGGDFSLHPESYVLPEIPDNLTMEEAFRYCLNCATVPSDPDTASSSS